MNIFTTLKKNDSSGDIFVIQYSDYKSLIATRGRGGERDCRLGPSLFQRCRGAPL